MVEQDLIWRSWRKSIELWSVPQWLGVTARILTDDLRWREELADLAEEAGTATSAALPKYTTLDRGGELAVNYIIGSAVDPLGPLPLGVGDTAAAVADVCDAVAACQRINPGMILGPFCPEWLVRGPGPASVVLIGAGIGRAARKCDETALRMTGQAGPFLRSMSPEECAGNPLHPTTDVFHAACFFIELAFRRGPFPRDTLPEYLRAVQAGAYQLPQDLPEPFAGIIRAGIQVDPARRPTITRFGSQLRAALGWWSPSLRIIESDVPGLAGTVYELDGEVHCIGHVRNVTPRHPMISIPSDKIGRLHATIERRGDHRWLISDGGLNTSGIIVQGELIREPRLIGVGDRVTLGATMFELVRPGA